MQVTFIYGLLDPRTGACRYVGKTSKSLAQRLKQHIWDANRKKNKSLPRFRWINSLDEPPRIVELEACARDWREAEREWIQVLRREGARLLNCTDGGDGIQGCKLSEATKKKMSEAALTLNKDKDFVRRKAELANAAAAKPEARAKLSASLKAAFAKPEVKARLCAASQKTWSDPVRRAKFGESVRNRVVSDSTRAKISAAAKGRKISPETRAKMSEARRGKSHSEETKSKMRAAITPEMKAASAGRLRIAAANLTAEDRQKISDRMKAIWAERKAAKA